MTLTPPLVALIARKVLHPEFRSTCVENQDWMIERVNEKLGRGEKLRTEVQESIADAIREVEGESR